MAASATFALKVAVWFRRGRLFMVSPDSLGTACPLSGRNSTYRSVQISETSSEKAHQCFRRSRTDSNARVKLEALGNVFMVKAVELDIKLRNLAMAPFPRTGSR